MESRPAPPLRRAPEGDRLAKVLGILSMACTLIPATIVLLIKAFAPSPLEGPLVTVLVLVMALIPAALLLGVIAAVRDLWARRRVRIEHQARSRMTGLAMGMTSIVLCLFGIVALVFTSAASGRARAKDRAAAINLSTGMSGLVNAYREAQAEGLPPAERLPRMEDWLTSQLHWKNPWSPGTSAFRSRIWIGGTHPQEVQELARRDANTLGEVVFVLSDTPERERYLVGAVLTKGLDLSGSGNPSISTAPAAKGLIILRSVILAD